MWFALKCNFVNYYVVVLCSTLVHHQNSCWNRTVPLMSRAATCSDRFYEDCNGPAWTVTWNLSMPLCGQWGLNCTSEGVSIELPANNVSCPISSVVASLFVVDNVTSINLSNNSLDGSFPSETVCMSSLQLLNLSLNSIVGGLDAIASASTCASLQSLTLSLNSLDGSLPSGLFMYGIV
jgi:hypothetical protein